jgi:hypothetical protein
MRTTRDGSILNEPGFPHRRRRQSWEIPATSVLLEAFREIDKAKAALDAQLGPAPERVIKEILGGPDAKGG